MKTPKNTFPVCRTTSLGRRHLALLQNKLGSPKVKERRNHNIYFIECNFLYAKTTINGQLVTDIGQKFV